MEEIHRIISKKSLPSEEVVGDGIKERKIVVVVDLDTNTKKACFS
jgi:hypothetical protein